MLEPTVNVVPVSVGGLALPVVHAVTSDEIVARADFLDVACAVMATLGPRGALHLRAGRATAARLQALAAGLEAAQAVTGAWLVVNDRLDLALACRARGAQLTSRSLRVADARRAAPALAVGASVHSVAEARAAAEEGASWLVAGHVFATATHPGEEGRGLPFVRTLAATVDVPIVAIGGVKPEHCPVLRQAGAYGLAVIRGIWDAANAERAASDYLSAYDDAAGA
ncbi:MAG: thiamine phosphate synthase [Gemmatimonadetes bacterium]|jgi:thiazole tautomerase (transcriptional regulator TenI)|nr:thiamine phosphate synthase [Gemmatimonadota bacterium]